LLEVVALRDLGEEQDQVAVARLPLQVEQAGVGKVLAGLLVVLGSTAAAIIAV
jgi:hypothetical protein